MTRRDHITLAERAVLRVMDVYSFFNFGTSSYEFATEMVKSFGLKGFMAWGQMANTVLKTLADKFGEADAQMLLGAAALWNGCAYCGCGHTKASNLIRFKETGKLFPVDEGELRGLQRQRDTDILEFWRSELKEWPKQLALLERQWALKYGRATGSEPDDDFIRMSIAAWDWTNECTIVIEMDPVPAPARIGRDKQNSAKYEAARAPWRDGRKSAGLLPYK